MQLLNSNAASTVITLNPGAAQQQAMLLRSAALVTSCVDGNEADVLVRLGRDLAAALGDAEASRVAVKAPVLNLGKQIDALAKTFAAPLEAEKRRLGTLHAGYTEAEQRRVAEEQRQRDAEVRRLEEERRLVELNAIAQAAAMQDDAGLTRAIDAEEAASEAAKEADLAIRAPLPSMDKQRGAVSRRTFDVVVHDLAALYASRPDLCRIELNRSALNAVAYEGFGAMGIVLVWKTDSSFRA